MKEIEGFFQVHDEAMFGDIPTPDWNDAIAYQNNEISFASVEDEDKETSVEVKFYAIKRYNIIIILWKNGDLKVKLELMTSRMAPGGTYWYIPALILDFREGYPKGRVFGFYYKLDEDNRSPYSIVQDLIKEHEY